MDYRKLLSKSLRHDGIATTARIVWAHVRRRCFSYLDLGFDLRHGVDTCAARSIHDLDVDPKLKPELIGYEATPVRVIRQLLESLPIDPSLYSFIDYGSGKGRVLLLASERPFRRIVGIELSKSLHEIAVRNISVWGASLPACRDITSVNLDATLYELPREPLVLYFFTPFRESVLHTVITRIKSHLACTQHGFLILCFGSRKELLSEFHSLGLVHREIQFRPLWLLVGPYRGHLFYRNT